MPSAVLTVLCTNFHIRREQVVIYTREHSIPRWNCSNTMEISNSLLFSNSGHLGPSQILSQNLAKPVHTGTSTDLTFYVSGRRAVRTPQWGGKCVFDNNAERHSGLVFETGFDIRTMASWNQCTTAMGASLLLKSFLQKV